AGFGGGAIAVRFVDVSHGHQLGTGDGLGLPLLNAAWNGILRLGEEMVHQLNGPSTCPDHTDPHPVVGSPNLGEGTGREGGQADQPRSGDRGALEQAPACRSIMVHLHVHPPLGWRPVAVYTGGVRRSTGASRICPSGKSGTAGLDTSDFREGTGRLNRFPTPW